MEQLNDDIFQNNNFKKDLYKYNLFGTLLKRKKYDINTDNQNYAIFSFEDGNVWVWTIDNIREELVHELINYIPKTGNIVYKKNIANFINKDINILNDDDNNLSQEEFGCYYCTSPVKPKKIIDKKLEKANINDREKLIDLWLMNCEEINYKVSYDEVAIWIDRWLDSNNFYLYRDNDEIICFATYQIIDNYARIEHAYTKKEFRGKGYMANLIYEMTKIIIDNNYIPVLQTDINYTPSNKSYKNVGYVLDDILIQSTYEKKHTKVL